MLVPVVDGTGLCCWYFLTDMLLHQVFPVLCPVVPLLVVLINAPLNEFPSFSSLQHQVLLYNGTKLEPSQLYRFETLICNRVDDDKLGLSGNPQTPGASFQSLHVASDFGVGPFAIAWGHDDRLGFSGDPQTPGASFSPLNAEVDPFAVSWGHDDKLGSWTLVVQCLASSSLQLALHTPSTCDEVVAFCEEPRTTEAQAMCPSIPDAPPAPSSVGDIVVAIFLPTVCTLGCVWLWLRRYEQLNRFCLEPLEELAVTCGAFTMWYCCRCCIRGTTKRQRHIASRRLVLRISNLFPETVAETLRENTVQGVRQHLGFAPPSLPQGQSDEDLFNTAQHAIDALEEYALVSGSESHECIEL